MTLAAICLLTTQTTHVTKHPSVQMIPPMRADVRRMPAVTHNSCRTSRKRPSGLLRRMSVMRRTFQGTQPRLRSWSKRPFDGGLVSVWHHIRDGSTAAGRASKCSSSEAARRSESTGWSGPRKIPPSLCSAEWLRHTVTCCCCFVVIRGRGRSR